MKLTNQLLLISVFAISGCAHLVSKVEDKAAVDLSYKWPDKLKGKCEVTFTSTLSKQKTNDTDKGQLVYNFHTENKENKLFVHNEIFTWITEPKWVSYPPELRSYAKDIVTSKLKPAPIISGEARVVGVTGLDANKNAISLLMNNLKKLPNIKFQAVNKYFTEVTNETLVLLKTKTMFENMYGILHKRRLIKGEVLNIKRVLALPKTFGVEDTNANLRVVFLDYAPCIQNSNPNTPSLSKNSRCIKLEITQEFSSEALAQAAFNFTKQFASSKLDKSKNALNHKVYSNQVVTLILEPETLIPHQITTKNITGVKSGANELEKNLLQESSEQIFNYTYL